MTDHQITEPALVRDPYREWQNFLNEENPTVARETMREPIFIELPPVSDCPRKPLITALKEAAGFIIEPYEEQIVGGDHAEIGSALSEIDRIGNRLICFRPLTENQAEGSSFEVTVDGKQQTLVVLKVGPAFAYPSNEGHAPGEDAVPPPPRTELGTADTVIGVIDDGIGLFNSSFLNRAGKSRIAAVWMQSMNWGGPAMAGRTGARVLNGFELRASDIDALIAEAAGADTFSVTSSLALRHGTQPPGVPPGRSRTPDFFATAGEATHGAHVSDIAAGADPRASEDQAQIAQIPLVAVDLPSRAVADTTGRLLDLYVLRGLRWMFQAVDRGPEGKGVSLIVNLSYGFTAGEKAQPDILADALAGMVEARDKVRNERGEKKLPTYLVLPFGNSAKSRQVTKARYGKGRADEKHLDESRDWRVQPEDLTPSYLEIRAVGQGAGFGGDDGTNTCLRLRSPVAGVSFEINLARLIRDLRVDLVSDGRIWGRVYWVEPFNIPTPEKHITIALRPTGSRDSSAVVIPAGVWDVALINEQDGVTREVTMEIQRDDAPIPVLATGRQSYFDEETSEKRDRKARGLEKAKERALRSYSALAPAAVRYDSVYVVAAARRSPDKPEGYEPAPYSPDGELRKPGNNPIRIPTLAAVADDGPENLGILGAGVYPGGSALLSGSSVAAPQLTRALALLSVQGKLKGNRGAILGLLKWTTVAEDPKLRYGRGLLEPQPRRASRTALQD